MTSYTELFFSLVILSPDLWEQGIFVASGFCLRSFFSNLRLSSGEMQKTRQTEKYVDRKRGAGVLFAGQACKQLPS